MSALACVTIDDTAARLHDDSVNGPEVSSFPAQRFAELWVKERPCTVDDPTTGKNEKKSEADCLLSLTSRHVL